MADRRLSRGKAVVSQNRCQRSCDSHLEPQWQASFTWRFAYICIHLHHQICGIGLNGPCLRRQAEAEEGGSDREGLGNSGRDRRAEAVLWRHWEVLGTAKRQFLGESGKIFPHVPIPLTAAGKGVGVQKSGEQRRVWVLGQ